MIIRHLLFASLLLAACCCAVAAGELTKVLVLGNRGTGKSHILNTVLGEAVFHSAFDLSAVTMTVETAMFRAPDGGEYLLYNIPGLLDVDEEVAKRNAAEVEKAIRDQATTPVIVLFVLTMDGGRFRAEDLEAWRTISEFVPALKDSTAVSFAVNKVDGDEWETEGERASYEISLQHALRKHCGADFGIVMLPKLSKRERADFQCAAAADMQARLLVELGRLKGKALAVAKGARLELRAEKHKKEMADAKRAIEDLVEEMKKQEHVNEETRRQHAEEMARNRHEIDRLRRENENNVLVKIIKGAVALGGAAVGVPVAALAAFADIIQ